MHESLWGNPVDVTIGELRLMRPWVRILTIPCKSCMYVYMSVVYKAV